jgi:hypothetical protein
LKGRVRESSRIALRRRGTVTQSPQREEHRGHREEKRREEKKREEKRRKEPGRRAAGREGLRPQGVGYRRERLQP